MPRVHRRVKSTRGRPEFPCRSCSEPIKPGQAFYTWEKRFGGKSYLHVEHGFPKPSMLSNRKTAVIEDAIGDFPTTAESIEDIQSAMTDVAEQAREVGQEYESSADNMPENLQQGYQAEQMREVAQELESWADEVEQWEPEADEPTEDDAREALEAEASEDEKESSEPTEDDIQQKLDELRSDWLDTELNNAQESLGDLPEYQG